MLKKLRHKKTSKRIFYVLAAIIIPAFTFWGFSGAFKTPKEKEQNIPIKIFGRSVSLSEYNDALSAVKNMAIMQYGDNLSQMKDTLNLEAETIDRLFLLAEAKKRNIRTSDKEVIDYIESNPLFQDKDGFNEKSYNYALRYLFNTQPRIFEEEARQNLIIVKLYREITKGLLLNDDEILAEYKKQNNQISIEYIAGTSEDFKSEVNVNDEALLDYFNKNSLAFKRPLCFNLEYFFLEENNKEDLQKKIGLIYSRLKKNNDLQKTAKDNSLEAKETGLFAETDPIPGIGWAPFITKTALRSKTGQILPPVQIDRYYYFIKLKEKKEPYIPDFESIKEEIKEAYVKDESRKIALGKMEKCAEKLNILYAANPKTVDLELNAKAFGLKYAKTALFKFGSYIDGVGASDAFWLVGQALQENQYSKILEAPSGFFIIRAKEKTQLDEKKFSEEKEGFAQNALLRRKQEFFAKFIEELKSKSQRF